MPETIVQIAIDGWRLACRAIVAMPILSCSAFLAFLGCYTVVDYLLPEPRPGGSPDLTPVLLGGVDLIVTIAIIASMLIAMHRFVILGDVADRPIWRVPLTYRRFAGWLVFLTLPWLAPNAVFFLFGRTFPFLAKLFDFLCTIFAIVVSLRLMLLLPAVAVELPSADWRNAWSDFSGHAWKFFGAQFVACLPLLLGAAIILILFRGMAPLSDGVLLLANIGTSASRVLTAYLGAAVASRLFQNHGSALIGGGGSPALPLADIT